MHYKFEKWKYRYHYKNEHDYNIGMIATKSRGMDIGMVQIFLIHPDGFKKLLAHARIDKDEYDLQPMNGYFSYPGKYILEANYEMENGEIDQLSYAFELTGEEIKTEIDIGLSWDQAVPEDSLTIEKEGFVSVKRFYHPDAGITLKYINPTPYRLDTINYEICNTSLDSIYGRGVPGLFPGKFYKISDGRSHIAGLTIAEAEDQSKIVPIYPNECKTIESWGRNVSLQPGDTARLEVIYHKHGWSGYGFIYEREPNMVWRHNNSAYYLLNDTLRVPNP